MDPSGDAIGDELPTVEVVVRGAAGVPDDWTGTAYALPAGASGADAELGVAHVTVRVGAPARLRVPAVGRYDVGVVWPGAFVLVEEVVVDGRAPTPHDVARAGPGGEPTGGPWVHRVVSASSADGLTWTRDDGVRWAHASVPCAVADGDRILLYAVDADRGEGRRESTGLRVSTDGLAFDAAPFVLEGLPTVKALDPCVVRVGPGAFRLYYLASDAPGDPAATRGDHEIHVAVSDDGVRFREARSAAAAHGGAPGDTRACPADLAGTLRRRRPGLAVPGGDRGSACRRVSPRQSSGGRATATTLPSGSAT